VNALGGEFNVLLNAAPADVQQHSDERIALGIANMRDGKVIARAGYDGIFGVIDVFGTSQGQPVVKDGETPRPNGQMSLF
jgi:PHP family Zn ribbon phosphoesterase